MVRGGLPRGMGAARVGLVKGKGHWLCGYLGVGGLAGDGSGFGTGAGSTAREGGRSVAVHPRMGSVGWVRGGSVGGG